MPGFPSELVLRTVPAVKQCVCVCVCVCVLLRLLFVIVTAFVLGDIKLSLTGLSLPRR